VLFRSPSHYGTPPTGYLAYPRRKSVAIAVLLSFFFAGLGQLYVAKIKRGVAFIVSFIVLSVVSSVITTAIAKSINYTDVEAVRNLVSNPAFIAITLVSLGFWVFNMYDAYRMANKYNEASMRGDLARFEKEF
jgi:TM2 domain-containing membrane protein YozV